MGILFVTIKWETVMSLAIGVKIGHGDLGSKSIDRHQLIRIVIQKDIGYFLKCLFVLAFSARFYIVQR